MAASAKRRRGLVETVQHAGDQRQLGPAPVEVLVRSGDREVMVALEVVGQEAETVLDGQPGPGKVEAGDFPAGQRSAGPGEVAPRQRAEQAEVEVDASRIDGVLVGMGGDRPDQLADVVQHRTRHHRVQVDNRHRCVRARGESHVGHLGVVVDDVPGEAVEHRIEEVPDPVGERTGAPDLRRCGRPAPALVPGDRFLERVGAVGKVVEPGFGHPEGRWREVPHVGHERPEETGGLGGVRDTGDHVVSFGALEVLERPPGRSLPVLVPEPPAACRNLPWHDPALVRQVADDPPAVLLDGVDVGEHPAVEPLHDVAATGAGHQQAGMDVATIERTPGDDLTLQPEGIGERDGWTRRRFDAHRRSAP